MEIESRLLPCGLHVIGKPPSAEEAVATLVNIASLDRPEDDVVSLTRIIADSVGRDMDDVYQGSDRGVLADVQLLQDITLATREAVAAMVKAQTDADGRVSKVTKLNFFNMGKKEPWIESLHNAGYAKVDVEQIKPLFEYLEFCLKQVIADNELGALLTALEGEYILPGPGGDPILEPGCVADG